ncbi:nitrite reductase [Pseudodesulfovibrio sp. JC047]|uniref:nitrite reductase n=1 Tax=Pseudodesulfovibrio sp. JC047 TaxID=2683199 RepID=UPI001EF1D23F|nr:nitrite reductase [Pseudodesulfovibrio sp. JC047]
MKEYIEKLPMRAVKPRGDGSFTVVPRMSQGQISAQQLADIQNVVEEYGLSGIRVTAGQRIMIDGISASILQDVVEKVGPVGDVFPYKVHSCLGTTGCKLAMQDSMGLAERLEEFLKNYSLPTKLKSSVSGCSMCCAESMIRDIGLIGRKSGWIVSFGGNGGKRVRQGDVLAKDIPEAEAFEIIGKALDFYAKNAKPKERTARFVERVGVDAIKRAVFGE